MALTDVPVELSSTPGVVDNSNTTAITIDSNENVGIGTGASIDHKLHLEESGITPVYLKTENSAGVLLVGNNSEGNSYVSAQTSGKPLLLETQNTERLRITSAGAVGVGVSSPDGTFHVHTASAGTVTASSQADDLVVENNAETGITIISPDDQSARIRFTSPSTNNDVGGATVFYRQNINKMLVGTAVSGGKLALASGAGNETILLDGSGNAIFTKSGGAYLQLKDASAVRGAINVGTSDGLVFTTGSSFTERMRITSAGALAIGRTSSITAACLELQPPAQISDFSSYILNIGGDEADDAVGTKSGIGFGYTSSARTAAPATIGYETQATTGGTYGDLYFATRQGDGTGQPTVRMRINNDGHVTAPYNPAFRAYLSTEQTSNGEVTSGWTDSGLAQGRTYDRDGDFNTSNGRFTAPVDGVYLFSVMWDSNASQAGFDMLVNGGSNYHVRWEPTGRTDNAWESRHYSTHVKLDKNDYVTLYIRHASGSYPVHMGGAYWGHFAGCLIS